MSLFDRKLARQVLRDPVHLFAFGLGTGLSPYAPGTVGSLLGVALAWLTKDVGLLAQAGIAVSLYAGGVWVCGESARRLGIHDHGGNVWDEIVGLYLVLIVTPCSLLTWLFALALFRAYDMANPWPLRDPEHTQQGGAGILQDALVAALNAA